MMIRLYEGFADIRNVSRLAAGNWPRISWFSEWAVFNPYLWAKNFLLNFSAFSIAGSF